MKKKTISIKELRKLVDQLGDSAGKTIDDQVRMMLVQPSIAEQLEHDSKLNRWQMFIEWIKLEIGLFRRELGIKIMGHDNYMEIYGSGDY